MPSIGQSPEAEFSLRPECKASSSKLKPYICIWQRSSALDHILSCQIHLVLFTQRFTNQSIGEEEGYCFIDLMAVSEFLENNDMARLDWDWGDSEKVMRSVCLQSF